MALDFAPRILLRLGQNGTPVEDDMAYSMNGVQAKAIQPARVAMGGEFPKLIVAVLFQ